MGHTEFSSGRDRELNPRVVTGTLVVRVNGYFIDITLFLGNIFREELARGDGARLRVHQVVDRVDRKVLGRGVEDRSLWHHGRMGLQGGTCGESE